MPAISVVMPVYNGSAYLREAIDSILNQTFTDFEFIILNDGSTDESKEIILSYHDPRIRFHHSELNIGLPKTQNLGLQLAKGKYIARMDSDDLSLPDRLERQFAYMETHKDIALCGGFFDFIGQQDTIRNFNWVSYTDPELIKINLLFDCAICQPTVMLRNSTIQENNLFYNEDFEVSEDYELWVSISKKFQIANINHKVLHYRISNNQISSRKNRLQREYKFKIIKDQLSVLGIEPNNSELRIHDYMFYTAIIISYDYLPKVNAWINKLIKANNIHHIYDETKFKSFLNELLHLNTIAFNEGLMTVSTKQKLLYLIKKSLKWASIR